MKYSALDEKITNFIEGRIDALMEGQDAYFNFKAAQIILHLIPLSSFDNPQEIDIDSIFEGSENLEKLLPISENGSSDWRLNLEGILTFIPYEKEKRQSSRASTQIFRNACIEARMEVSSDDKCLRTQGIEEDINKGFKRYVRFINEYSHGPIFVFINLLNIKGYELLLPNNRKSKYVFNLVLPPCHRQAFRKHQPKPWKS